MNDGHCWWRGPYGAAGVFGWVLGDDRVRIQGSFRPPPFSRYAHLQQVAKVLVVVGLGFLYSLFSVAFSVLFLRAAEGKVISTSSNVVQRLKRSAKKGKAAAASKAAGVAPPKAYSDATMRLLTRVTVVTGLATLILPELGTAADSPFATPLRTLYYLAATCATYVWGARLPDSFTKAVHPLITSTVLTWGLLAGHGALTGVGFMDMLKEYKVGGALDMATSGAGDVLLYLLGPSVVAFAISMYSRKQLLADNFWIVVASMLISSGGGLFGTAAFVRLIQLGGMTQTGLMVRLSVLARNVTTALGLPITAILGGDMSIAAVVIVLTGIVGAQYGRRLLDAAGISDPVTRGLAVGSSGQGLGVSSMIPEEDAFPFAAMAMVLTAVSATTLVSIPFIKDALVNICS